MKTENDESTTCQNSNIQPLLSELSQSSAMKKPYESMFDNLANDPAIQKEVAFGQRIGFYNIREEIGAGNFSKVNLSIIIAC